MVRSLGQKRKAVAEREREALKFFENEENWAPERFENSAVLRRLHESHRQVVRAETDMAEAVSEARSRGLSWAKIGRMIGTSGEAARQRYREAC